MWKYVKANLLYVLVMLIQIPGMLADNDLSFIAFGFGLGFIVATITDIYIDNKYYGR